MQQCAPNTPPGGARVDAAFVRAYHTEARSTCRRFVMANSYLPGPPPHIKERINLEHWRARTRLPDLRAKVLLSRAS